MAKSVTDLEEEIKKLPVYFENFEFNKRKDEVPDTLYPQDKVDAIINKLMDIIRANSIYPHIPGIATIYDVCEKLMVTRYQLYLARAGIAKLKAQIEYDNAPGMSPSDFDNAKWWENFCNEWLDKAKELKNELDSYRSK